MHVSEEKKVISLKKLLDLLITIFNSTESSNQWKQDILIEHFAIHTVSATFLKNVIFIVCVSFWTVTVAGTLNA